MRGRVGKTTGLGNVPGTGRPLYGIGGVEEYRMHRRLGFTLIEMLIVIAIIAILATIAYPSYRDQVSKTRRSDAKSALTRAAQLQERFFTQNGSYKNTIADLGGNTSPEGYYSVSVQIQGTAGCTVGGKFYCFLLTAQPAGAQAGDDCGSFTLDHTGAKNVSGGSLSSAQCW